MIVDITNILLTDIINTLDNIKVISGYQSKVSTFPTVSFAEIQNDANLRTKDSDGFHHSNVSYRVEIYTKGNRQVSQSKEIRDKIDSVLSDKYGLTRLGSSQVPNYLDDSIYRYVVNYNGTIDKNREIYRG